MPQSVEQEGEKGSTQKGPRRKARGIDRRGNAEGACFEAGQVPALGAALSGACASHCWMLMGTILTALLTYWRGIVLLRFKGTQQIAPLFAAQLLNELKVNRVSEMKTQNVISVAPEGRVGDTAYWCRQLGFLTVLSGVKHTYHSPSFKETAAPSAPPWQGICLCKIHSKEEKSRTRTCSQDIE